MGEYAGVFIATDQETPQAGIPYPAEVEVLPRQPGAGLQRHRNH
ncbi:MAG: hypothetical protein WKF73_11325 [Nocardioidaceae bacterium]